MRLRNVLMVAACGFSIAGATYLDAAAEPPAAKDSTLEVELKAAIKARVESAQAVFDAVQVALESHGVTLVEQIEASRKLCEAQVAAASSSGEAIAALTANVQRAKQLESYVGMRLKSGFKGVGDKEYQTAKRERQSAEIALLEARIKAER